MTEERYKELSDYTGPEAPSRPLTKEEFDQGWHYCYEWDGLLVGENMAELLPCRCLPKTHKVYLTIPKEETEIIIDL